MIRRITIKNIKNKGYIYEWEYIPKDKRNNSNKRFKWTYKGPVAGNSQKYLDTLSKQEIRDFAEYIYEKAYAILLKKQMKELEKQKPFSDMLKEIDMMNRIDRKNARQELREELEVAADVFVNKVLSPFTPEEYWEYLKGGGNLYELINSAKL